MDPCKELMKAHILVFETLLKERKMILSYLEEEKNIAKLELANSLRKFRLKESIKSYKKFTEACKAIKYMTKWCQIAAEAYDFYLDRIDMPKFLEGLGKLKRLEYETLGSPETEISELRTQMWETYAEIYANEP